MVMSNFLLEIYCEEIPPKAQIEAEKIFKYEFESFLNENKIESSNVNIFSTSRRIVIFIDEISSFKKKEKKQVRGPTVSSGQIAIDGFMKSNEIDNFKRLIIKEVNKKKYYFFEKKLETKKTSELLTDFIPKMLKNFKWKKSMRWADLDDKWIRPIKEILCLFDSHVLKFSFAGVDSSSFTYGNYLYNEKKIKCDSIKDYKNTLKKNYVILDRDDRKKMIISGLSDISSKKEITFDIPDDLLTETSSLVEYPNLMVGCFDKEYFSMPDFLLITVITGQQKYFVSRDRNGKLSNLFSFITNHETDKFNMIKKGNERVLKARFNDALFFLKEDKSIKLEDRNKKLKEITYFGNLGNVEDKSIRLLSLSVYISKVINFALNKNHKKILLISKSDLTSELVKEFPNLQGLVGSYYAELEGYTKEESDALKNQYRPVHSSDSCPKSQLSICLAVSEKIDQISGAFLSGNKPTGSRDPFALRRSALGIIRILIENKVDLEIKDLINFNYQLFKCFKFDEKFDVNEVISFTNIRLFVFLKDMGFRDDVLKSVISTNECNPYLVYYKVKILTDFISINEGKNFLSAYKRIDSILVNIENKKIIFDKNFFSEKEEKNLYDSMLIFQKRLNDYDKNKDFLKVITELQKISSLINLFFDNVKVNIEDEKKKRNRINLLTFCKFEFDRVCLFSFFD